MEYHRYLQEVVQALESDPDFRERLEKANEDDVRVSIHFFFNFLTNTKENALRISINLQKCMLPPKGKSILYH